MTLTVLHVEKHQIGPSVLNDLHRGESVGRLKSVCGNDFTRPTGDINVNCLLYTKRPPETKTSTQIFVICHFSFGDQPPLGEVSWRPTGGAI